MLRGRIQGRLPATRPAPPIVALPVKGRHPAPLTSEPALNHPPAPGSPPSHPSEPPPPGIASRLVATLALAGALVVNSLAQTLPLGGRTTGELSALYPNVVVPVGATFSIWGLIYLGLLAWTGVQFLPRAARLGARLAPLFALTSVWNAGWLVAWHHLLPGLSVVVMASLLGTLVLLHLRLEEAEARGEAEAPRIPLVLARGAFGLYLGWILVATVVNLTAWLVSLGWEGWGLSDVTWGALVVGVGIGVAALVQHRFRNAAIGGAAAWGFLGTALAGGTPPGPVTVVAGAGVVLLLGLGVRLAWRRRRA
jgi:benzodiazapine receptor